jgi:RNA polymerase sigma-70 factor (ECF subfamily)
MSGSIDVVRLLGMDRTDTIGMLDEVQSLETRDRRRERATNASFEPLYVAHREAVLRYLRVRARDADSLDLAALTFERAFRTIAAGGAVNLGWLLRTARNAAIDAGRRQRTRLLLETIVARLGPEVVPSPELQVVADETASAVRRAVNALPSAQREAIALRYAGGLSARQIGGVLGKSEAASQKLISRALEQLRENLHDQT